MKTKLRYGDMTRQQRLATYTYPKATTIRVFQVPLTPIVPNTSCKALVPYGLGSGSAMGYRLANSVLSLFYLTPLMLDILLGIILGDASIRAQGAGSNPCITHVQGFLHLEYSIWMAMQLAPILTQLPALRRRRDGTYFLTLHTRSLPCLIPLLQLFIVDGVKRINMRLIEYLTPAALAY